MIVAGHGGGSVHAGSGRSTRDGSGSWPEAKKRAYVNADNKLALSAGWNEELLAAELTDPRELAFGLGAMSCRVQRPARCS